MGLFDRRAESAAEAAIRRLYVHVEAHVDDDDPIEFDASTLIPPGYDAADVRALTARKVEDAAFDLVQQAFGRQPTRRALLAATARLIEIRRALNDLPDGPVFDEIRERLIAALDVGNDEAIALWGEQPEA